MRPTTGHQPEGNSKTGPSTPQAEGQYNSQSPYNYKYLHVGKNMYVNIVKHEMFGPEAWKIFIIIDLLHDI